MKEFTPRTVLASWLLEQIAAHPALFAGSDYHTPLDARRHEHTPDCTCTSCDGEFFEDELCESCGLCHNCCTCTAAAAPADPDDDGGDDSGECPFYDDDKRAGYWYANHTHSRRYEVAS